jgi:hypothetical protein
VGKGTFGENCEGGRWLVRGAGAASLQHLQIVPHELQPICILIYLPPRPTHEVSIVHCRLGPELMHQIKPYSTKSKIKSDVFVGAIFGNRDEGAIPWVHLSGQSFVLVLSVCESIPKYPVQPHNL